jgi:drug/metabolite transporter (DMT)-like permease
MGAVGIFFAFVGVAVFALYSLLRRERRQPGSTHPFLIGMYRGLTAVLLLLVGFTALMMIATAAANIGRSAPETSSGRTETGAPGNLVQQSVSRSVR